MSGLSKDSGLYRNVLLGALAAGSGVAVYYGFTRWRSRPLEEQTCTAEEEKAQGLKDKEETPAVASDAQSAKTAVSPPESPIQTSTPAVSRASSNDANNELLSLSGSFEKVSLSALRENHDSDESSLSGQKSPSENFEKVSLPQDSPVSKDTPSPELKTGSSTQADSGKSGQSQPTVESPRVQFDEKIVKYDSPVVQSSPVAAKPKTPPPVPPKPEVLRHEQLQSVVPPKTVVLPKSTDAPSSAAPAEVKVPAPSRPKPVAVEVPTVEHHSDGEAEEGESDHEDDEDEEGSASDASGDSQVEVTRV